MGGFETKRAAIAVLLAAGLAACGAGPAEEADDYAEAIPDAQMLELTLDDGDTVEQGLGDPASFRAFAEQVMAGVNELVAGTQQGVARFAAAASVRAELTRGATTCAVWEQDADGVHWQLLSCEKDRRARRYAFALRGRPVASTLDEDYRAVFAGEGVVLPRFDGRRRGAGRLGYDFDAWAALTGKDVEGKVGIGYRAAGRARQLVIGLAEARGEGETDPNSAIFRYVHVQGRGGFFSFLAYDDFLARDAADQVIDGQDGLDELGRAAIAWNAEGGARTVLAACGGTLGDGVCVRIAKCWSAAGAETWSEASTAPEIAWSETACAATPDVDAPAESDGEVPAGGGETAAPELQEPGPIDGE